jgi:hypothetical protein
VTEASGNSDDGEIFKKFLPIFEDLKHGDFPSERPLLAHYTTIQTFEQIVTNNEFWFSNPLFMNDFEEVRFGVEQGNQIVMNNAEIARALGTEKTPLFQAAFAKCYSQFANEHAINTYVFCLSKHEPEDNDGLLSMWRGYGANGNGIAIVFDTSKLADLADSPLIIGKVDYESTEGRISWLQKKVAEFARLLTVTSVPSEKLYLPAYALFERIKYFALFTKHRGFKEEAEWRVVYMPDRDKGGRLNHMFHYSIGKRGIEPKLKFKVLPIPEITVDDLSITKITDRIILGPTVSSPIAVETVRRMLTLAKHPELARRVVASRIPFRAP